MRKLRMLVTSVIVLAIVVSAFAFNSKKTEDFCVGTINTTCNLVLTDKRIITNGTPFRYYKGWDKEPSTCVGPRCTDTVKVINN